MTIENAKRHKAQSLHYFENALKFIDKGDAEKASELLWGSMSQALKAVAAAKAIQLRTHRQIRDFAFGVTKTLSDENIWNAFEKAQSLHSNFYECGLLLEDVQIATKSIKAAVDKLLKLIPQET